MELIDRDDERDALAGLSPLFVLVRVGLWWCEASPRSCTLPCIR